jgi:hypothetical protein
LRPYLFASFNGIQVENIVVLAAYLIEQERNLEMSRAKALISILMVLILIALSGASVWAAPGGQEEEPQQPTTIRGIVEEIEVDEEANTVFVTLALVDETDQPTGETQRVSMSLAKAQELGLVDEAGNPSYPSDPITITLGDDVQVIQEVEHPVALALAEFFGNELDLDIMGAHEDGFGFGLIAQACWMSYALEGDATLFRDILDAKKGHTLGDLDLTAIEVPEGETPTNWGQFKKVVLGSKKAQRNLGEIMSGRAEPPGETDSGDEGELGATSTEGKVKGKKDQAGGKPDAPPGQVKNKDKGKGGGKNK